MSFGNGLLVMNGMILDYLGLLSQGDSLGVVIVDSYWLAVLSGSVIECFSPESGRNLDHAPKYPKQVYYSVSMDCRAKEKLIGEAIREPRGQWDGEMIHMDV
jgi:hypothetical protein